MEKTAVKFIRNTLVVLLIGSIGGCAPDSSDSNAVMLDSFEKEISKQTVDFGSAPNSSLTVTASTSGAQCGKQAIALQYELENQGYLFCARGYGLDLLNALCEGPVPEKINWTAYKGVRLQMKGNKTGSVALDIKDAGGEIWRFLIEDNAEGWREITAAFDKFVLRGDWQPPTADGNRKLDFPIRSFQFEPKTPGKGVVEFDCVQVTKG